MVEDLEVLGLREEAAAYSNRPAAEFELWPENETTWDVFTALGTQWRKLVMSNLESSIIVYEGIAYHEVVSTLQLMGIKRKKWPEIFKGIRIMEMAALPIMNK